MTTPGFIIRETRHPSGPATGRYEYRVWPWAAHPAVSILHRFWPVVAAERRTDVYLLHAESAHTLVKLRDGYRLEIKRRGDDVGTVQHWTMPLSTEFPLAASDRAALAAALHLPGALRAEAGLSPAHLLAELDAQKATVVPETVRKSRLLFQTGDSRAEICRVATGGWTGTTIALEARVLPDIAMAVDHLHLGSLANRSYGEALGRLVGLPPARRRRLAHAHTQIHTQERRPS